jgi:BirA family biotin operon repressor/biotin-[acetyl-CoA-carboxylase] ligase
MDAARLRSLLEYDCHPVVRASVTTTNDEVLVRAAELARSGGLYEALPLVVVSAEQTAGRGRLGRVWASPAGGLYLSVLVEGTKNVSLASLSPLTALAVHEALQPFTSAELLIKWPNDLISEQGKLAGILVETRTQSAVFADAASAVSSANSAQLSGFASTRAPAPSGSFVVIGIGVNVKRPVEGAFAGAAWLGEGAERRIELEGVAAAVINSVLSHHAAWLGAGCSFAPFAARYREHMALLGRQVCVRDAAGGLIASGQVEGIDEAGRLVVAGEAGVVPVAAGEVTLRNS